MVLASAMSAALPAVTGARFYVATDGNDAWSGAVPEPNRARTDGPFATLHRARDAVRELKAARKDAAGAAVIVRAGTYYLPEPLRLGPEDSGAPGRPIVYCAYPGEEVVLSAGRAITNWRKGEGSLWIADLPEVKAGKWHFRQLFVAGQRQVRARTPNLDPADPIKGGWHFVQPPPQPDASQGAFGTSLVCIHSPGDTFQWKIDVPADGEYALWMYYGAKNEPFGRKDMAGRTTVQIDDRQAVYLQNLPDTGNWRKLKWSRTGAFKLTKGEHRLRWTNVKGGGLNWDAFALCDDSNWVPKGIKLKSPPEGKHLILVQCETYESGKGREFRVDKSGPKALRDRFHFRPGDIRDLGRSPDAEIHIFPAWGWVNAILSIDRIDRGKNIVFVKNKNCSQELRPGNRYFVENASDALNSPGEWSLDRREGRLYYWPKDPDFQRQGVVAPALDRIIDLCGDVEGEDEGSIRPTNAPSAKEDKARAYVEHVTFRGFTFRHTKYSLEMASVYTPDDGAIWLRRARHCVVERCKFLGVGGYAVRLSLNSSDNQILGNTVAEAGQGGVLMKGYETARQPRRNLVAGNHIHHCGRIWKHVAGVYVTTGSDNRIAHNTITDVPRYGISLKSFRKGSASHNNVVEYNRLLRTNLETNDTGAIETLGRDREDSGNVIRCNLILDVVGLKTSPEGEMITPHYTWGIYLDDYSSGTHVYGNIVARTVRGAIHVHLGRNNVFENNILVDAHDQQFECNGREFMANNKFVRNIVCFHRGALMRIQRWHDKVLSECDQNLYWQIGADLAKSEEGITPKGPLAQWQAAGYDKRSLVADPCFLAPEQDDYRLAPESPAWALGFKAIDVERIGVEGYRASER